jgi:purine-nucleoside phosphorylase
MASTYDSAAVSAAVERVRLICDGVPDVGLVLGSGLGAFVDRLQDAKSLHFSDIPNFPQSSVVGHVGKLVFGRLGGIRVLAMAGRVHSYEGYDPSAVAFPVRVLGRLGIRALVVTNAAGCINAAWNPGELMRIADHINLTGRNPLVGPNDASFGERFPDMSHVYDPRLAQALESSAQTAGLTLRSGIYAGVLGPSYETPAEIRMLRSLGADAVGMSTVLEVIAAAHMRIPVAGISCLTNMAAGILGVPLTHAEVTATAERVRGEFVSLLETFLPRAVAAVSS